MPNIDALAEQWQEVFAQADREGRPLTEDEEGRVNQALTRAEQALNVSKRLKSVPGLSDEQRDFFNHGWSSPGQAGRGDPGARFISSEGFKALSEGRRPERFSTGLIEITDGPPRGARFKGTLGEAPGSGGGAIPQPQVVPGLIDTLFQPLSIERALGTGIATSNAVRYVQQGTATSAAAGVAEGGEKPESTIGFETMDEPIKKIATFLPIAEELLEDAPAVQQFINTELTLFVQLETERQLIRGTAGGNEVQGLLTNRGVPVYAGGTAAGNKAEQLFRALNSVRGSAYVEPDFVVISPSDYEEIRLLKDLQGQLYGGGPFFGPYGGAQAPASASGQVTGATDQLWGKNTYVTAAVGPGTAIVGSSSAATVWSKGGVSVEASNSHDRFFQLNLVALRAERRAGLALLRKQAIVECRLS